MGWLIALGVLTLIAIIPVGVSALYDEDGPCARIIIGPIHMQVFPSKGKEKKEKPQKSKQKNTFYIFLSFFFDSKGFFFLKLNILNIFC